MREELNLSIDPIIRCQQFLSKSAAQRLTTLQAMGLERYQQLLCQMAPTSANEKCLLRFLIHPQQVKFPQLQDADLQSLNLQGMNLIRVKFNNAQLQDCSLQNADLIFGDFTGANLSGAHLRGCTINESIWTDAIVIRCDLRGVMGLSQEQQQWLRQQGAILDN
jgi:Pentapeptide repeats (8 copies)